MRLLLDTSIVVHVMQGRELTAVARRLIEQSISVHISAVTVWEMGIKTGLGKLRLDMDEVLRRLSDDGFEQLPVTWRHGRAVRDLPHYHRDPFDRLLVAQAIEEPMRLLTHDLLLQRYSDLVSVA